VIFNPQLVRFCPCENLPQAPGNLATPLAEINTFLHKIGDIVMRVEYYATVCKILHTCFAADTYSTACDDMGGYDIRLSDWTLLFRLTGECGILFGNVGDVAHTSAERQWTPG